MASPSTQRLPAGMRDFAPDAATARRQIAETLLRVFARWGFARVITPGFEYEEVLALGLGSAGRAAAIRFVEPSSGQVVALPPDITPQIARLIATRFRDEEKAIRLCYEGAVVRLDHRARSQREVIQAGVEMAGVGSVHGDAEVIALGAAALASVGLQETTITLGHLGLAHEVFAALALPSADDRQEVRACILRRDGAGLRERLRESRVAPKVQDFVARLPEMSGPPSILSGALRRAPTAGIRQALENLGQVVRAVALRPLPARLLIDLGEVRGSDYYTGTRFQGYVDGAAEPVLQGGRYDTLLGRYGRARPAVGFAIDVEATAGALEAASPTGELPKEPEGVLIAGPLAAALALADEYRAQGKRAAVDFDGSGKGDLDAYARRWHFAEVVRVGKRDRRLPAAGGKSRRRT